MCAPETQNAFRFVILAKDRGLRRTPAQFFIALLRVSEQVGTSRKGAYSGQGAYFIF